ncbi:hypothetical protein BH23PLA1_BH23PLA1_38080 [soil metagenome]
MAEDEVCPKCGARLPSDAPQKLCPACLMGFALGDEPTGSPPPEGEAATRSDPASPQAETKAAGTGPDASAIMGSARAGEVSTVGLDPTAGQDGPLGMVRYFGDYELLREIARGGMGVVFEARQVSLGRPVAMKMILSRQFADRADIERFRVEAQAAAHLDHPHIVPIFEVGEHQGLHYYSMRLIRGGNLAGQLPRFVADPRAAARLMATVAQAVHYAYQRGVLHRDLKPANILVDEHGEPHLTDFGLAKRSGGDAELTRSGDMLGTPAYMAPEQAAGRRGAVTTASDVYGLGAVLYAALKGRPPFRGETVLEVLEQVRGREPEPQRRLNPRVDRDLDTICLTCLHKDPQRRYRSAEVVAEDLRRWLAHEPIWARQVGHAERLWLWARRRPALAMACGLAVVALVGVIALSIGLAVQQSLAADRLRREQQQTTAALRESRRLSATLALDRGQGLCEQENADRGLLWLARGLEVAPAEDAELLRTLRTELGAWGRRIHPLRARLNHGGRVEDVAYSPDGNTILTGGSGGARLWDAATGRPIGEPLRTPYVTGVAFSPDGRTFRTRVRTSNTWTVDDQGRRYTGVAYLC